MTNYPVSRENLHALSVIAVISARKLDLFNQLVASDMPLGLDPSQLSKVIGHLDPDLFVTFSEAENRFIECSNTLDDLDRERIGEELSKELRQGVEGR
jgi:hypothetical protein